MDRLLAQSREREYAQALLDYIDAVNDGGVPEVADVFDTVERLTRRPAVTWARFIEQHLGEL